MFYNLCDMWVASSMAVAWDLSVIVRSGKYTFRSITLDILMKALTSSLDI